MHIYIYRQAARHNPQRHVAGVPLAFRYILVALRLQHAHSGMFGIYRYRCEMAPYSAVAIEALRQLLLKLPSPVPISRVMTLTFAFAMS